MGDTTTNTTNSGFLGKLSSGLIKNATGLGIVSQIGGSLFGALRGLKMMKDAKKINPIYTPYQTSQAAKDMQGLAQTRLNARNPFQEQQKRAMLGSQANALSQINRGSVDPSQALAMTAGIQGQTNEGIAKLAGVDAQMDQQNVANLMQAQNVLVGEDRMKYQDMINKYQMDMQRKDEMLSSGAQSISGAAGNLASTFLGAAGLKKNPLIRKSVQGDQNNQIVGQ